MNFQDGWIPDETQARKALEAGTTSDRDLLLADVQVWDDSEKTPAVWDFHDFWQYAQSQPDAKYPKWWEYPDAEHLFTMSQETLPNCAGFAFANASQARILLQTMNQFSEQKPAKFNPLGCWQASKKGSLRGGQTISAMADAGRKIGNVLVSDVGEYSDSQNLRTLSETALSNASRYQASVSLLEGDSRYPRTDYPEIISTLLRKGYTIFVGGQVPIADGRTKDSKGVEVLRTTNRQWAHATAFAGFQSISGADYVFWINSHGPIYPASDGSPAFGGWMDMKTLEQFVQGQFFDLCVLPAVEAPHDPQASKTLNPWAT